ncbi:MAG: AMP-binding protein [Victivallales bacterium]|nr:AMP-binding protein [Victivallales bacterium]
MIGIYLLFVAIAFCLWLRYRIKVIGLDEVYKKGNKGILFLPNHPALIDPVIMSRILFRKFHPRALVDEKQIRQTILKHIGPKLRMLPLPDMGIAGRAGLEAVVKQIELCADALKAGDNLLLYPAGRIYRSRREKLRGNGGVERIIERYPDVRIVLVRTRGLWGSSFSRGRGYQEPFMKTVKWHIRHLLGNLLFFMPRRDVTIEFVECPADFPKHCGDKEQINRWLENFYNEALMPNTYVPYYWWEKGGARVVPEPEDVNTPIDTSDVPNEIRDRVYAKLHELTPKKTIVDTYTLGTDLGLDSLMVADLQAWIQDEFGQSVNSVESLRTVGSVLKAAIGQTASIEPLQPIPPYWFRKFTPRPVCTPEDVTTVTGAFLAKAASDPGLPLLADQITGVFTCRKAVLAIMVLRKILQTIPDERLGILMPPCSASFLLYMATLFAGKVPVMVNWTVGPRNLAFCLDNADCKTVLTSIAVIENLKGKGTDFSEIEDRFIYIDNIKNRVGVFGKLWCLLQAYTWWGSLRHAKVNELGVILFTSGSENRPKTVPLTHANLVSDIRNTLNGYGLTTEDCLIGMLPPFHSFGLLLNVIAPACAHLRVAYHTNPMESNKLARMCAAYEVTMIIGTPTFAAGIMRAATQEQLKTIRYIVLGGEKCPIATYRLAKEKCPQANCLEGYGITECSPVLCLNPLFAPREGSLGKVIANVEAKVIGEDGKEVPAGQTGLLHVRGPSIFGGYLNFDGPSPFVTIGDGPQWYNTGDIVSIDNDGFLFFAGRKKRFCKVGGEMISLPAIEEVLLDIYRTEENPIPLAVEAIGPDENPEITLFTNLKVEREVINAKIREAGFSPIHFIRRLVEVPEIPLLGTGKTDYRTLKRIGNEQR